MLNFLNTAILAVAVAAVFPFLLHLFSKRKVRVIPFSSITFLKAMQKRQVRAIKIKQLLLLIIRTLIILAVVLAFARPATQGGYLGSHAAVSAVIVVDNSASMGLSVKDGRLFELAVKRAEEILEHMGQSDEVAVLATSTDFSRLQSENLFGNSAAASALLDEITLTDGSADLAAAYHSAVSIISDRQNLNREIYLISDFQVNSLDSDPPLDDFDGKTFLVDLPAEEIDNSGILSVDLGNQLIEVGTGFIMTVTVKKISGGADETLVSVYLDDNRVAQDGLRLRPSETGSVGFELTVSNPGFHSGYILLSDDDLLADNRYHFSFYIPDQFNILLVGEENLDTRLLKLALAPDENLRRHWSVKQVSYRSLLSINLGQYDILIMANYSSLPAGDVARVKEYVKNGGGLLLNLGQRTDSAHFNQNFAAFTGVSLESTFPRQFSRSGYYILTDFDLEHQILSVFKDVDGGQKLSFRSYAMLKATINDPETAHLLARYSDGSPAVTVSASGRGRIMLFNCDISPDISDISLHPFFVPFIVRASEFLSSDFSSHTETILAGSAPTRNLRRGFNIKNEFVLVMPDRQRRIVAGGYRDEMRTVDCGKLDKSGVYSIFNGSTESDRFAVNIDSREGDTYREDWDDLAYRFGNSERLPYGVNMAGFISEKRYGRELWQYFLIAALILLLIEMYVARDRGASLPSED